MHSPPPVDVDAHLLAGALADSWALKVTQFRYIPKGSGSYHWLAETPERRYFLTVDDLDAKPWLGSDRDSAFEGLCAAYDSALALHRYAHLAFVVAPVPQLDDATALRLSDRYTLTAFPFTDGEPGVWGEPISGRHRELVLQHLAELHRSTPVATSRAPRHRLVIEGRAGLEAALDDAALPWTGGPFSEPARREVAEHAATVHQWLTAFDSLVHQVNQAGAEPVVTHGEPHPSNLIFTDGGVLLVDWDTVGRARPERDLWMLDDGSPDALAPYVEASGRAVDDRAIALYRLAWTLTEIAAFTARFRSDHERDADTQRGWHVLTDSLLGAGSSRPYGVRRA